ncbi:OsmC family protein [Methanospirillum lacunae]|nr:OsmC family protein [Methanospirillum lacunae]
MSENDVQITLTQVDDLCFEATTVSGNKFFVEASAGFGGTGNNPSPLAHFLGALGGCTLIKTKLELVKKGVNCESVSVQLIGTQREIPPHVFETIHLSFTLKGKLEEKVVFETIKEVISLNCPVAVMIGKAVPLTWDYKIVGQNDES